MVYNKSSKLFKYYTWSATKKWKHVELIPVGQGAGTFGLPRDYTPPSRFVRTACQKSHILFSTNREEAVMDCFHVMESVSIPKGIVMTAHGTSDYTQYTSFINLSTKDYYYKTYNNRCIIKLAFRNVNKFGIKSLGKLNNPFTFQTI